MTSCSSEIRVMIAPYSFTVQKVHSLLHLFFHELTECRRWTLKPTQSDGFPGANISHCVALGNALTAYDLLCGIYALRGSVESVSLQDTLPKVPDSRGCTNTLQVIFFFEKGYWPLGSMNKLLNVCSHRSDGCIHPNRCRSVNVRKDKFGDIDSLPGQRLEWWH